MQEIKIDKTLDIKGLTDPRPKAIAMGILENMEKGQVLRVIASDRTTRQSIPSLCESLGYTLLDFRDEGGIIYFTIRK